MTSSPKIIAFSGSTRKASWNKKLVALAVEGARKAGGTVKLIDLSDYELPLYNQDYESEHGLPENAQKLKQLFSEHQGFLISSPEYNGSISPLMKNTIDWVSRPAKDEKPLLAFKDKLAVLMAASPGGLGGIRALPHLATILNGVGVTVLPNKYALSSAHQAFSEDGKLKDERTNSLIYGLGEALTQALGKMLA